MHSGDRARGFTLPGLLAVVAITLLGLGTASTLWSHERQREQERALIRIGSAYALALERYRQVSPGSARHYPADLGELVHDPRFVGTTRHLRRLYDDPLRPGRGWRVVRGPDGRIVGVHSASETRPLAQGTLDRRGEPLPPAARYSEWIFRAREWP